MEGSFSLNEDHTTGGDKYFYPVPTHSNAVEMFKILVEQDLVSLNKRVGRTSSFQFDNLTKAKKLALKILKTCKGIVIRQADKGGSVVVMSAEEYNNLSHSDCQSDHPISTEFITTIRHRGRNGSHDP